MKYQQRLHFSLEPLELSMFPKGIRSHPNHNQELKDIGSHNKTFATLMALIYNYTLIIYVFNVTLNIGSGKVNHSL